jgi:glycosyltransferase involved in cell wall biosynthesis
MKRKISLGILAYNEALVIPKTLESLFKQSLLTEPNGNWEIEIIVIPNGCKDDTAQVAQTTLKNLLSTTLYPDIHWQVHEVEQPGKTNAWNLFVHQFSHPKAEYIFLIDADIQLLHPQTLNSMVEILEAKPEAWVAVDKPIKDIAIKTNKTLIEQLSVWASGLSGNKAVEGGASWICGQLYCARSSILRKISLPLAVQNDDSFIYTMIVTDGLKCSEEPNRVILAPSASHIFEAYTEIGSLFRHEKWLIFGQVINELFYADLKSNQCEKKYISAIIQEKNEQDPLWLNQLIQQEIQVKGGWLIPNFILIRRFKSLAGKPILKAILFFPLAFVAFLIDLVLAIQVNQEIQANSVSLEK